MKTTTWIKKNMPSLSGKVIAVSGATGGIGVELCRHLAALEAETHCYCCGSLDR